MNLTFTKIRGMFLSRLIFMIHMITISVACPMHNVHQLGYLLDGLLLDLLLLFQRNRRPLHCQGRNEISPFSRAYQLTSRPLVKFTFNLLLDFQVVPAFGIAILFPFKFEIYLFNMFTPCVTVLEPSMLSIY